MGTFYLSWATLSKRQLLFVVLHCPTVLHEVSVGGGQRHVDDGELSRRLSESLGAFQLPKKVRKTSTLLCIPFFSNLKRAEG